MKKSIVNPSFLLFFVFASVSVFAQTNENFAFAETTVPIKENLLKNNTEVSTNLDVVLAEISTYLSKHVKSPEALIDFYNTDMTVLASFNVSTKGELENITFSKKSDKTLGEIVVKELNKLSKITPIMEDGQPVEKYISVPVVFNVK